LQPRARRDCRLPAEVGSQPVTGSVRLGGDGFFDDGVLTVTRVR
jgi:hypothetical protein